MRCLVVAIVGVLACTPTPDSQSAARPVPDSDLELDAWPDAPDELREAYVREFLTASETPLTTKGWSPQEQVIPDPDLLHGIRTLSPGGSTVRAVAIANAGIHPRWTFVFLERASQISVVATYTFWGQVQQKRAGVIASDQFDEVLEHLKEDLECLPDPSPEYGIWLRALAYWEGETLFVCDAFMKEGPHFSSQLDRILENATTTHTEPEEPAA